MRICRLKMQGTTNVSGAPHALPRGTILHGGRYRIEQTLGYGGFAITYLAYDAVLHRLVAIKELIPDGCAREANTLTVYPQRLTQDQFLHIRQRFLEEGRLLAGLNHPNTVRIHDAFEQHNTGYLVMEYLHGQTLAQLLQERGGVMPEQEAVGYILQICEALQLIHQRNYLHRDIKPSNIIVTHEGRAVLIDFGAAREYAAGQTRNYTVMLTPIYAALEQFGATGKLDGRTDLHALGATLYHLVTGAPPLTAPDRARGLPLPPPRSIEPKVSEGVSKAILHAMGLYPDDRPASVQAWADELKRAIGLASLPPQPPRRPPKTRAPKLKRLFTGFALRLKKLFTCLLRLLLIAGLLAGLVGLFAGGVWLVLNRDTLFPPRELTLSPPVSAETSTDINESIQKIVPGGVIYLEPGTYTLSHPIIIAKPLRLVGKGSRGDVTIRLKNAPGYVPCVVRCKASGTVEIENIVFIYEGDAPACVCQVLTGKVRFRQCAFRGGVWNEQQRIGGSGILLFNEAEAEITDCVLADNGLNGIAAQGSARLTAQGNTCEGNKQGGIALLDNAQGEVSNNTCRNNGLHGTRAEDSARLTAQNNTCEGNEYSGIALFDYAQGEVSNNTCRNNGLHGIKAQGSAQLIADANVCEDNKQCGILFIEKASGRATNNTCRYNKWGISVEPDATPIVTGNNLYGNTVVDLFDWRR